MPCTNLPLECLEVSSALRHWSRSQPMPIAIEAKLLAISLEQLAKRPDDITRRDLQECRGPGCASEVASGPDPRPNTIVNSRSTLTPSACSISRSADAARVN